ncbi:MAG: Na+/H+ antiporter NhaA [Actinomycetota bacterium]
MPNTGGQPRLRVPWSRSDRRLPRLVARPLQQFLQTEAAGGILLLAAAAVALVWANVSPASYDAVWHGELTLRIGSWGISEDIRHWVNDALMALFFFVVGLEIKRELVSGELRDPRAAALPAFSALGGMVVPGVIYAAVNAGGAGSAGWGIPMATDIAFAVGVLAIVGRGLPSGLKLFLLTLAIVDDIGAIVVIAIFYSGGISWPALGIACGLLIAIVALRRARVRPVAVYAVFGAGVWLAVFESGIHATIAGVVLGLLTPAVPFGRSSECGDLPEPSREELSPLTRLEVALHPWTSFVIIPLFALANAGVYLGGGVLKSAFSNAITVGVVVGLVVGKTVGISLAAWAGTRSGLARLPIGVTWFQLVGAAAVGGIGFTVSLFIAGLAFSNGSELASAKVGILAGSLVAGVLGGALLMRARRGVSRLSEGD